MSRLGEFVGREWPCGSGREIKKVLAVAVVADWVFAAQCLKQREAYIFVDAQMVVSGGGPARPVDNQRHMGLEIAKIDAMPPVVPM